MKQDESVFDKDYFRELLETVRSIRASERRIWQQITDIFAEISYDKKKLRGNETYYLILIM
ncbi:RhuM family protein [Carnobacterium inhibens]|uniref:RhuM family protein n=1 Tax=Carnobacterium inhibens TaxID=147709 RepID=UPI00203BB040|nr:RhuM family protein [Carnobacterium inhibens]